MARRAVVQIQEEDADDALVDLIDSCKLDPLRFVEQVFPWGEAGTILANETGPDEWQRELLLKIGEACRGHDRDLEAALRFAVASGHGVGKALAHGTPVLTWHGWVPVEQLSVGDMVISDDGQPTRVRGVFPQGERDLFRVTLDDGTWVDVDGDHLWHTTTRSERKHGKPGRTRTTREVAATLTFPNGPRDGLNHELPVVAPVQHQTAMLPIEPYLFGCWLGDGSADGRITGEAPQFEALMAAGVAFGKEWRDARRPNVITRTPLGISTGLRALGLRGCRAHEKRVPRVYMHGNISQRVALLQGLLDTDGTVGANCAVVFETTSSGLGDDVAELVRSLGGVVRRSGRRGGYAGKACRQVYRLYISLPREVAPFRLPAKAARYRPQWGTKNCDRTRRRFIRSVEPIGRGHATCISVASPSKLFVTKDHIVTHNTTFVAWIILWFISTRPNPQVIVTANTQGQLTGKTWRELAKWHRLMVHSAWFQWTATKFYFKADPETWFASAVPWTKERAEAFAGTHEEHVLIIMDEASAIDDAIWEVAEGAMTTHGAMWMAFGNPTRSSGRFRECFRTFEHRWHTMQVDSRKAKKANQAQIKAWIEDYGEDSDFVRVRVRGEFPRAASNQFIAEDIVTAAQARWLRAHKAKIAVAGERAEQGLRVPFGWQDGDGHAATILSVDIARFGDDESIVGVRKGRVFQVIDRWRELDLMQAAARIARLAQESDPDAIFVDEVGIGAGVVDRLRQMGFEVEGVNGALKALEERKYFNRRMEMWDLMRSWLKNGGMIDGDDKDFAKELTAVEYGFDAKDRLQLEAKDDMKARGLPSPDVADSLSMTFFMPVLPRRRASFVDKLMSRLDEVAAGTSHMSH